MIKKPCLAGIPPGMCAFFDARASKNAHIPPSSFPKNPCNLPPGDSVWNFNMRHPHRRPLLGLLLAALCISAFAGARAAETDVPPADLSKLKPSDFADDELDLPYYVANFH